MIDGVVAVNQLDSALANRVRADLWAVLVDDASAPPADPPRRGPRRAA